MREWVIEQFVAIDEKTLDEEKVLLFSKFVLDSIKKGWGIELQNCLDEARRRI
jgi:hypothetical protein